MRRHRYWALAIVALGLGIALWAWLDVKQPEPGQDPSITIGTPTQSIEPTQTGAPTASPTHTPPKVLYPIHPKVGAKIGTITLPTLGESWPVFEGTKDTQLAKGVGHYVGSVLPGIRDNTILSGHRTTVFNHLGKLKRGELIQVKTSAGVFTYKVRSFKIVMRSDRTVIMPTKTAVLTLTTCYPFNNLGATTKAFVVTADIVQSILN